LGSLRSDTLRSAWRIGIATVLLVAAACIASAQADSGNRPFVGTWKLNSDKSQLRGAPPGFELFRQYEDRGNGWMLHTVISVSPRGVGFLFSAARYDGKQYPVWNARLLGKTVSDGQKTPRTVEFERISAYQLRWTDRTDGKLTLGGLCTVSPDGMTLTITANGARQHGTFTQIFDRVSSPVPGLTGVGPD
jgi:hypothetical protein